MAENPTPDPVEGSGSQPAAAPESAASAPQKTPAPPVDTRPKPQFGELAPPGWVWTPPADSKTGHQQEPMVVHKPAHGQNAPQTPPKDPKAQKAARAPKQKAPSGTLFGAETPPAPGAASALPADAQAAPAWDRPVTLALLVLGIFGVILSIQLQSGITQSIAIIHEQEGIGAYTPVSAVSTIVMIGGVVQIILWLLAAGLSLLQIRRRRRAFWIPIVVGVLSAIAVIFVMTTVLLTDATLLNHFAELSNTQ
ncbi:DUF6264 family protein [Leifsonia flava]|uniref:Uncharacterized protein n=1 Tax=Orlajensenia leifsoniae TaxID=2561933 RepID=A0A4Y9QP91_9MICO|nr:DUF6264 family protein [Leifsonia flava]TFV94050.1 hypothetical protein E4M00_17380 [Leifsonia flava]